VSGPGLLARAGLAALLALTACKKEGGSGGPLRLAYFPNLTHAQALVGDADGTFARALGAPPATRQFNAGPAAMEALLAGDVDVAYVGPGPATVAYLRSKGTALRVIAGAVSGGASLVVRSARAPHDLVGKRVASPQLGNTQDIALRTWLRAQGLAEGDGADKVKIIPLSNPDVMGLFARGELEGAWVPEPWAARLRAEAGGRTLVDERDMWPGGRFPTTIVVATQGALASRRGEVVALLRAHAELTERWRRDPQAFARAANEAYGRLTRHPLPEPVLQDAFAHLAPELDPLAPQLLAGAKNAQELKFAPAGDASGMVDATPLADLRSASR